MQLELLVAGTALLAVIAYAVLAGADFGGGIWDLLAIGPRRAQQRGAIASAMGPVWEANHVWLIFLIVILFTAFPRAFALLSVALFIPFHLVLLGIILRGAAFVFRAYSRESGQAPGSGRGAHYWGGIFGASSTVTPILLGMCLGSISSGRLRIQGDGLATPQGLPWLSPLSATMGLLAIGLCAYLAAVYLTNETSGALRQDFRRRALAAGTLVVALSALSIPLLYAEARHLWDSLISLRAAPVLVVGGGAALVSGWALWRQHFRLARIAAIVQVAGLLAGWGVAQYPYMIYPDLTLEQAAAPAPTLRFVLWSLPPGMALLLPSLWLLFRVFKSDQPRH